jgi:CRISPR-associated protein (TIGR03984 family)
MANLAATIPRVGGTRMITLYGSRQTEITLMDAIAACQTCFSEAVGLFYSPEWCLLGNVCGTQIKGSDGADLSLSRVFEARLFNVDYELRWLNQRSNQGTAVLLSEHEDTSFLQQPLDGLPAIATHEQTYLLWGEGYRADLPAGWSRLATARLGKLDLPISGVNQSQQRVKLIAKEYFHCLDDLYGNVIVAEERLMSLQKV